MRYCAHPGCSALVARGYCPAHQRTRRAEERRTYAPSTRYGRRWARLRASVLAASPWCVVCQQAGQLEPATDVDHIVPHRGDPDVFWDRQNLQPLCHACHSRKTAEETLGAYRRDDRWMRRACGPD